jgi:hypothetical protein
LPAAARLFPRLLVASLTVLASQAALAFPLVVVEARGGNRPPGSQIDSETPVSLKVGEKLVLIAPDGRISTLRGAYGGKAAPGAAPVQDPRRALAALISTRNDRANTVGAVRSGSNAAALPDPWLVDVSRPGERCVRQSERPIWWRPDARGEGRFAVFPVDRSWRADFRWADGQDRIPSPALVRLDGVKMMVIQAGGQERAIRLHLVPDSLKDPVVLAAWMLEKACVQQADALLRSIEAAAPAAPPPTVPAPAPPTGR